MVAAQSRLGSIPPEQLGYCDDLTVPIGQHHRVVRSNLCPWGQHELPAGNLRSLERDFTLRVDRGYQTAQDFEQLILGQGKDGYLVRLGDVARIELGPEEVRKMFRGNAVPMVGLGIVKQSTANTLAVTRGVKKELNRVRATLPAGIELKQSFDSSV